MPATWGGGLHCCHMWRFPPFKRHFSRPAPPWGGARRRHGGGFLQKATHTSGSEVFRVEGGESQPGIRFTGVFASAAASVGRAPKDLGRIPLNPGTRRCLCPAAVAPNHKHSFLCFYFGCWYNVGGVGGVFPFFISLLSLVFCWGSTRTPSWRPREPGGTFS